MKRLIATKVFHRDTKSDQRERTIMEYGDPVTVERSKELLARLRLRGLSEVHPVGL
ncbi:MAG: hypothetical protein HRT80_13905 [Henriciella sp.]|nr:hypothetical protein [Henriciella sp.]